MTAPDQSVAVLDYTNPMATLAGAGFNPADRFQYVALHESAHVVAAAALGHPVERLVMRSELLPSEPGTDDRLRRYSVGGHAEWDRISASPRDCIIVAMAGEAAISLVHPDQRFDAFSLELLGAAGNPSNDRGAVCRALADLNLGTDEEQELERLWEQTRAMMQDRWEQVLCVTTELLALHHRGLFGPPGASGHTAIIHAPSVAGITARRTRKAVAP